MDKVVKRKRILSIKNEVNDLHPILDSLFNKLPNIQKVEYTHGPNEIGADFVLSKLDDTLGITTYIGVIAKIGNIKQNFIDIERQIEECNMPRKFQGGTKNIRLQEIWITTTGRISKNAKDKIYEKFKNSSIHFLDGEWIVNQIDHYMENYWFDVDLEISEFLKELWTKNDEYDKNMSLININDRRFYIEQDIYELDYGFDKSKITRRNPKKIDIFQAVNDKKVILIEGGMGSGKSKLLRKLIDTYSIPHEFIKTNIFPVFTTYKDLIDKFNGSVKNAIDKLVTDNLIQKLDNNSYFLLLIDGVDEKRMNIDEKLKLLTSIITEIRNERQIKAIITSRYLSGLDKNKDIVNNVERYEIRPLSTNKIIEFISSICTQLNITSRIIEDLKKSSLFRDFPHNPIAAILLAELLNENSQEIPATITELYSKYLELILGRWDIEKGLQSQKEYEALDNIMMRIADFMVSNELSEISLGDVKRIFKEYLDKRNLSISSSDLFEKAVERCEIVFLNYDKNTFSFKHRTFAEYFYAKSMIRDNKIPIDNRIYEPYWINTFFFCVGIKKDCPELLKEIIYFKANNEPERWMKVMNTGDYLLAGFTSPYEVICDGIIEIMKEASSLYIDITSKEFDSIFSNMPTLTLLSFLQFLIRHNYARDFFSEALEKATVEIDDSTVDVNMKVYSLFFIKSTCAEIGFENPFDFVIEKYNNNIPLEISLALNYENKDIKNKSLLMKKLDRRLSRTIKGNPALKEKIKEISDKPIRLLRTS